MFLGNVKNLKVLLVKDISKVILLSKKEFLMTGKRKEGNRLLLVIRLMSKISLPQVTCYSYYEFRFPVDCFIFP